MDNLLSVGVDIGTSTTSMVISRLTVKNTAALHTPPRAAITGAEIIYRSSLYPTPLSDASHIDADAIADILNREYKQAGVAPEQVQTGAVIITGESSRKENASRVARQLSRLAGTFVVAAAGPSLEAIIAAKGAGSVHYSQQTGQRVANFDIGGGTTNIALFRGGVLEATGCWDIGGRLIQVADGQVTRIAPSAALVAERAGVRLQPGDWARPQCLQRITDHMALLLCQAIGLEKEEPLCRAVETKESAPAYVNRNKIENISFSGGVAEYIYHPITEWFRHGDIGPLLADSVRRCALFTHTNVIPAQETIRATVIGAGVYTTTVSGSTISYSSGLLPIKDLPAFVPSEGAEQAAGTGQGALLQEEIKTFLRERVADNMIVFLSRLQQPNYYQVRALADALAQAAAILPDGVPLIVVTEQDYAKALGQALRRELLQRPVICIDKLQVEDGDYLDLGKPILGGIALPVVVKTLLFGKG